MANDGERFTDPDEPFPDLDPDDIYRLRDWAETDAPDWMEGLYLDTMARLDHVEIEPPEEWETARIIHSPDPDDPWIVEIDTEDGTSSIDFGDNWDAAWQLLDWIMANWPDIEREYEVEY